MRKNPLKITRKDEKEKFARGYNEAVNKAERVPDKEGKEMKQKVVYAYNLEHCGGACADASDKRRLTSVNKFAVDSMADKLSPDCLKNGGCCYGLVFEQYDKVQGFILRMSEGTAKRYGKKYQLQKAAAYGDNWYSLSADYYEESKRDYLKILEECYDYTLSEYCAKNAEEKHCRDDKRLRQ